MNAQPVLPPVPTARRGAGHGKTVLVVDDYAPMRDLVAWHLAANGYEVLMAGDPVEAQRLARPDAGWEIDLLVTDVEMPTMRGDALARWFARERPKTRVLFMSASQESLRELGDARVIEKPFSLSNLSAAVRAALAPELIAAESAPDLQSRSSAVVAAA